MQRLQALFRGYHWHYWGRYAAGDFFWRINFLNGMGTMINEVNIRGIDNGTLILVNGNPVSWRGKYNVQEIPAESIERIEIVKGGGSVLYGSEAMAGVVNIITKTKAVNQATIGFGNYGQQNYQINAGDNEFSVNYSLDKWNHLDNISESTADTTSGKYKKHFKGTTTTNIRDIKNESMAQKTGPCP